MTDILVQPEGDGRRPLLVEVTRGDMVESRHAVAFATVDAAGRRVAWRGEVEAPVYARSAIKGLQALPLLETGAADRWGLSDAEIALACASHSGEPRHVETVLAWLERMGLSAADLECGSHLPYHEPSAAALIRAGKSPSAAHNNCSGKHAGFLATARHKGEPTKGYIAGDHPVQRRVARALEEMCGADLGRSPVGIDGCGIPTIGIPLEKLALGMARLADPAGLPAERRAAAERILRAVAAEPFMVAGSGRFCTEVMAETGPAAFVKTGAEALYQPSSGKMGMGHKAPFEERAGGGADARVRGTDELYRLDG